MSRIRSIHPGIWTDEKFISVTPLAELLFIGLWNFADDGGVFEWNPIVLKAKIFPARRLVIKKLLTELQDIGMIECYEVDGKSYGQIKDFEKWQHPRNPVYKYPKKPNKLHHSSSASSPLVVCSSSAGSPLVVCSSSAGSLLVDNRPENDNEINGLQKKLSQSTGGREEKRREEKSKEERITSPPLENKHNIVELDDRARLFKIGTDLLVEMTGKPISACRGLIGKWLKQCDNEAGWLLQTLETVKERKPYNPEAYICKIVQQSTTLQSRQNYEKRDPRQEMREDWHLTSSLQEFHEKYDRDDDLNDPFWHVHEHHRQKQISGGNK